MISNSEQRFMGSLFSVRAALDTSTDINAVNPGLDLALPNPHEQEYTRMEISFLAFLLTKTNCNFSAIRHRIKTRYVSVIAAMRIWNDMNLGLIDNWVWDDKDLKYLVKFTTYHNKRDKKLRPVLSVGGGALEHVKIKNKLNWVQ